MIGQAVSHYRITEKLGEGGMGEVYLAEDTSLGRTVALKFLPAALQRDTIAHKRFIREARSAAALDHPYICNIFEVGETDDGTNFIAMEYLEGETLQARLGSGPLTLRESLKLGSELAEALESAHSKGIVHRDLKPANIMITPSGHTKVMDFGLAKKLVSEDGREQDISSALTREGATLGTLSYMSPEQLRGQPVDYRSDIFSLGIVLYEMLSGVHPFRKSQAAETTGVILRDDPPSLERFVTELPEVLRHTVEKMLAKDPAERYQSVHEVLTNLNQLREDSGKIRTAQEPGERTIPGWVWMVSTLALAVLLSSLGVWELWFEQEAETTPGPLMRTSILLPEGERLASGSTFRQAVAISPDGRWVAYASYKPGEGDEPDGDPVINLRRLDQTEVRRIPGFNPFFSPDSQQLGFVALVEPEGYLLKRTVVEGVTNETVASLEMAPFGCDWLPDDTIIFSPGVQTGLFAIPAVGGEPRALTRLDEEASEFSHRLPSVLPDGRSILYTALRFNNHSWNQARIVAERLDTGGKKVLIEGGSDGRYVASGHLLFAREGSLMAIQLDADHLEIRGEAVPVLDGVVHAIHSNNSVNETSAAQYGTSLGGLLIYAPGSVYPERSVELVWVDGRGREKTIELPDGNWSGPKISPDGEEVSLVRNYPPKELWIYGVERRTLRRQTVDGSAGKVIWGPEEGCLTLNWDPEGPEGIWVKTIDSGSERGEEIVSSNAEGIPAVGSWSPHGRRLAFSMWFAPDAGGPGDTDIWILDRQGRAEPWLQTRFREYQPEFSPDGRWLAYTSDESGRREVYVRPFPGLGRPLQVSTESGTEPSWSRDGAEIFYVQIPSSETTTFKAVKVRVDSKNGELRLGAPRTLFSGPFSWGGLPSRSNYDVGPDGRFLVRKPDQKGFRPRLLEALAPNRIELVQNWFEELSKKVPTE